MPTHFLSHIAASMLVIGLTAGGVARAAQQSPSDIAGLVLELSSDATSADAPALRATLRNTGDDDTAVVAGMTLANGKVYLATNFRVHVSRGQGQENEEFRFVNPRYAAIAGRVDPWVVPLPRGSSYTLTLPASHFMSKTSFKPLDVTNAGLEMRMVFDSTPIAERSGDLAGLRLLKVWTGRIASAAVRGTTYGGGR